MTMTMTASGSKTDQIYDALRTRLMQGHYQFGEVLSTYELAQEFGVSRRPVMDAAMRLASEGFISIIPQVGCRVIIPDEERVREHFALAGILEGAGAKLAALNATEVQLADIDAALGRCAGPAEADDAAAFAAANRDFHSAVLAASGNQRLTELAKHAWDLSDFYIQKNRVSTDLRRSQSEHSDIAGAISRREPGLARELMEGHLSRFWMGVHI
ncbi:GntR family transcriptional regulator [Rhodococcus opacus]|nr:MULTISPECIES: GntR family transcriptional regulator [Rhodococcus]MDJ0420220.1 GntR family transcriptional regulator [Rhodococcus opacus]MDV7090115.1 GntR family transcriptional regulator [Rhodococcus opacus]QHE72643.1 Transcriptional regulator, GntR family [Rhodococcus sp. WAY2]UNN04538.1 GntR family transcriptional regulator [Rhodococcus opacus]WKN52654.1 GntR family transcriptional regulator [Rhodococcus opacus]